MQERSAASFLQFALPTALMLGLAIFGSRGKRGGMNSLAFLGSAFKAYSEGRSEDRKEKMDEWWKQVQLNKEENTERHQQ